MTNKNIAILFSNQANELEQQNRLLQMIILELLKDKLGNDVNDEQWLSFIQQKAEQIRTNLVHHQYKNFPHLYPKMVMIECIQFKTDAIKYDIEKKKEYIKLVFNTVKKTIKNIFE